MAARYSEVDSSSRARFLDANKELKQKILSPIRNYESLPLVSLEEAVRPLENISTNLQTDVWVAKKNCEGKANDDNLTHDERASIHLYTMQHSIPHHLNEALRRDDRDHLLPWFLFLKLFLTALWKLKPISCTVWRGMKGNYAAEFREMKSFFWYGVSSCTLSHSVLEKEPFIGATGARTLIHIDCTNGIDIKDDSYYENAQEVLLLPCSYFEVLQVTEEKDLCMVYIRQHEPPVLLIQSPLGSASLEQPSRSKRRRQKKQQRHRAANANPPAVPAIEAKETSMSKSTDSPIVQSTALVEVNTSSEQVLAAESTDSSAQMTTVVLNFNRLKMKPRKSVTVKEGRRMAASDQYFLVCPKNRLRLLDVDGNEHWSTQRDFEVDDVCYSTYLKQFLILADEDLYSLDLQRPTKLMVEIPQFAADMDECTCHENLFIVIKDFGGAIVEVWDIKSNWKLMKTYVQPISCKDGQGICTIRFSSDGKHLGVTLIDLLVTKAFFQLRNAEDMKILRIVELPFYEGFCNHYSLSLPNNEFLVFKYSEKAMFLIDSSGQRKEIIRYSAGICTMAVIKRCFVIQTSRPDDLRFYNV